MPRGRLKQKLIELRDRINRETLVWEGDVSNIGSIGVEGVTGHGLVQVELDLIGGRCWVSACAGLLGHHLSLGRTNVVSDGNIETAIRLP
jgi:hypothetical protein